MRSFAGVSVSSADIENSKLFAGISEEEFSVDDEFRMRAFRTAKANYPDLYGSDYIPLKAESDDAAEEITAAEVVEDETPFGGEIAASEIAEPVLGDITVGAEVSKPKYRPSPTFCQKMLRSDEVLQDRYDELKNYALRFKKLKSRLSKKFDSINKGRLQFVKLSVAGKTLKLYLNMDINECDAKFHCKDMLDKKTYVTVPVLLRIKSARAVRYAKILIDKCAEKYGLVENKKFQEVDAIAMVEDFYRDNEKQS